MKWKLNALAAVIAIAVSAPASATIANSGTGNGELFFTVWDATNQRSYTKDLGISINTWNTNTSDGVHSEAFNVSADANWTSFLSGVSNVNSLQWNIGALDGSGADRYLTTAQAIGPMNNEIITQFNDNSDTFLANTNTKGTHPGAASNGSNLATVAVDGNPSFGGGPNWGSNFGGKAPFSNAALINSSNFFWLITESSTADGSLPATIAQFANGIWNFATSGDLTYSQSAVSAVPVPAAVWLLGSGLLGLVGVARRRRLAV